MAWDLHTSQRVVCIDDNWTILDGSPQGPRAKPRRGIVYTVSEVRLHHAGEVLGFLRFNECCCYISLGEIGPSHFFDSKMFRPLDERDLDQFRVHIAPVPAARQRERV